MSNMAIRLTRLPFPTPYSRNVSTRLALGGPSPCPVIPSHPTPGHLMMRPMVFSLLFSSTSALTSAPPSQRSPAPAPKRRGNLVELGTERGLRPGLASLPAFPFFSHYITCLDLLFSLIHHQKTPGLPHPLALDSLLFLFPCSCAIFDITYFFWPRFLHADIIRRVRQCQPQSVQLGGVFRPQQVWLIRHLFFVCSSGATANIPNLCDPQANC